MVGLELQLPAQRDAPGCARRALSGLAPFVAEEQFQHAELLISELVTNSVRHAGVGARGWVRILVTVERATVRIEVADAGAGFEPDVHSPEGAQTSGYGLFLVDELASRWGVEPNAPTRVWFELARA